MQSPNTLPEHSGARHASLERRFELGALNGVRALAGACVTFFWLCGRSCFASGSGPATAGLKPAVMAAEVGQISYILYL